MSQTVAWWALALLSVAGPPDTLRQAADRAGVELRAALDALDIDRALQLVDPALAAHAAWLGSGPEVMLPYATSLVEHLLEASSAADYDDAERLLDCASSLGRERLGDGHPLLADCLSETSTLRFDRGDWSGAAELEERALVIRRAALGARHPRVADSLSGLAVIRWKQGEYGAARALVEESVSILEEGADEATPLVDALNTLGEVERAQGRYEPAVRSFQRGIELAHVTLPDDHPALASLINNLALALRDQGRYDLGERLLAQALETWRSAPRPDRYLLAVGANNLAEMFRLQGEHADAAPLYEQAVAEARGALDAGAPDLAWFLNQQAVFAAEDGRPAAAEALYDEAIALLESSGETNAPLLAQCLHDLADLLCRQGRRAAGLVTFARARALRAEALGARHPDLALTLVAEARCRADVRNEPTDILQMTADATAILAPAHAHPHALAEALALHAELLELEGQRGEATDCLADALELVEELRPHTGGSEQTRAAFLDRRSGWFRRMVSWQVRAGDHGAALAYAERARARVLLDQISTASLEPGTGPPTPGRAELLSREDDALAALAEHQARHRVAAEQGDDELLRALEALIDADLRLLRRVRTALTCLGQDRVHAVTASAAPVSLDLARARLVGPGGWMLVYQVGEAGESLVLAIPPSPGATSAHDLSVDQADAQRFAVPAGPLTTAALAQLLHGSGVGPRSAPAASERPRALRLVAEAAPAERLAALFRVLLPGDLWPRIRGASEVVIVPHGLLAALPFEALVVPSSEGSTRHWLDEGPVVRYAPSLASLARLGREPITESARRSALVVSDPIYAEGPGGLAPLPGTAREADAIRAALAPVMEVDYLQGPEATEQGVRAGLAQHPRYLHFATHGLVDTRRPDLLAALALTPGDRRSTSSDGFLQLFEIYELELAAELAVLSACESHAGTVLESEGVQALSRGLLAAGARRVIASIWWVDDDATAFLMSDLYRTIAAAEQGGEGIDYARALRDARRRTRAQPRWAAPHYWAPFVLIGAR